MHKKRKRREEPTFNYSRSYRRITSQGPIGPVVTLFRNGAVQHDSEDKDQGSERLEHPPGEAQVDFGVMEAVEEGKSCDATANLVFWKG